MVTAVASGPTKEEASYSEEVPFPVDELVPFSYSIMECLHFGMPPKDYERLVVKADEFTLPYLRAQSVRWYNLSGFGCDLLDTCNSPGKAAELLTRIGKGLVRTIQGQQNMFQRELWETLGGTATTPRALIFLDERLHDTVEQLKQFRGPKANKFMGIVNEQITMFNIDKILYTPIHRLDGPNVSGVNQKYSIAPLTLEALEMLQQVTPPFLVRGSEDPPLQSPERVLRELGKLGIPFTRVLAEYCKDPAAMLAFQQHIETSA